MTSPIADYAVSLGLDGRVSSRDSVSDAVTKRSQRNWLKVLGQLLRLVGLVSC
jgi:hypothetical protein